MAGETIADHEWHGTTSQEGNGRPDAWAIVQGDLLVLTDLPFALFCSQISGCPSSSTRRHCGRRNLMVTAFAFPPECELPTSFLHLNQR